MVAADQIRQAFLSILQEIESRKLPYPVTVVAASKYVDAFGIEQAYDAGIRYFGENKVMDALAKMDAISSADFPDLTWHFIGHLQSNKINKLMGKFSLIHSVDSLDLAQRLAVRTEAAGITQPILLQVNVSGEETKSGFSPQSLKESAEVLFSLPALEIQGLMTMAPYTENVSFIRSSFEGLRLLRDELRESTGYPLTQLSMGMSHDYIHALDCGATILRIGSQLFKTTG